MGNNTAPTETVSTLLSIPLYSSLTTLALEQGRIAVGTVVATMAPFAFYQAVQALPVNGQYATLSTASATYGAGVTYWVQLQGFSPSQQATPNTARAVASVTTIGTAAFHAYTGTGTGTLTSSANQAFPAQDGVTVVAGDQIFVPAGLTGVTAVDSGPWVLVNAGSASTPWVLSRPWWFFTGNKLGFGATVVIGPEGSVYNNTVWKATAGPTTVIDTTDCSFYCKQITFQVTLVAGVQILGTTSAATNQPTPAANFPLTGVTSGHFGIPIDIASATQSQVFANIATKGGTVTTTVCYQSGATAAQSLPFTPGYARTSVAELLATISIGVQNTSDTSTLNVTIINQV